MHYIPPYSLPLDYVTGREMYRARFPSLGPLNPRTRLPPGILYDDVSAALGFEVPTSPPSISPSPRPRSAVVGLGVWDEHAGAVPRTPTRPARTPLGSPTSASGRSSPPRSPTRSRTPSPTRSPIPSRHRITFYVDARGVRDDFYATMITSPPVVADMPDIYPPLYRGTPAYVAVAVGSEIKLWSHQLGPDALVTPIRPTNGDASNATSMSAAVGDMVAVGYADGSLHVFDSATCTLIARTNLNSRSNAAIINTACGIPSLRPLHRFASSLLWIDDDTTLVAGDSRGALHRLKLVDRIASVRMLELQETHCRHTELICSLALDCNNILLAVGANDNSVSLWELMAPDTSLRWYQRLLQPSAIKALTFCPYLPRLLAVGTGRHDRTVRIYNAEADTIVQVMRVPGQVVALVWLNRWELFVALGHGRQSFRRPGDTEKRLFCGLGVVYELPSARAVRVIEGEGRSLNAVRMGCEVCVVTSRKQLVFFQWTGQGSPRNAVSLLYNDVTRGGVSPRLR